MLANCTFAATSLPPPPLLDLPHPDFSTEIPITAVTLFRYSALTFNAHLIHYDHVYCREIEGLPGVYIGASISLIDHPHSAH